MPPRLVFVFNTSHINTSSRVSTPNMTSLFVAVATATLIFAAIAYALRSDAELIVQDIQHALTPKKERKKGERVVFTTNAITHKASGKGLQSPQASSSTPPTPLRSSTSTSQSVEEKILDIPVESVPMTFDCSPQAPITPTSASASASIQQPLVMTITLENVGEGGLGVLVNAKPVTRSPDGAYRGGARVVDFSEGRTNPSLAAGLLVNDVIVGIDGSSDLKSALPRAVGQVQLTVLRHSPLLSPLSSPISSPSTSTSPHAGRVSSNRFVVDVDIDGEGSLTIATQEVKGGGGGGEGGAKEGAEAGTWPPSDKPLPSASASTPAGKAQEDPAVWEAEGEKGVRKGKGAPTIYNAFSIKAVQEAVDASGVGAGAADGQGLQIDTSPLSPSPPQGGYTGPALSLHDLLDVDGSRDGEGYKGGVEAPPSSTSPPTAPHPFGGGEETKDETEKAPDAALHVPVVAVAGPGSPQCGVEDPAAIYNAFSIKMLREEIGARGGTSADCIERRDLVQRLVDLRANPPTTLPAPHTPQNTSFSSSSAVASAAGVSPTAGTPGTLSIDLSTASGLDDLVDFNDAESTASSFTSSHGPFTSSVLRGEGGDYDEGGGGSGGGGESLSSLAFTDLNSKQNTFDLDTFTSTLLTKGFTVVKIKSSGQRKQRVLRLNSRGNLYWDKSIGSMLRRSFGSPSSKKQAEWSLGGVNRVDVDAAAHTLTLTFSDHIVRMEVEQRAFTYVSYGFNALKVKMGEDPSYRPWANTTSSSSSTPSSSSFLSPQKKQA